VNSEVAAQRNVGQQRVEREAVGHRGGGREGASLEADFDLVHADLLRCFPDLVRDLGGDPEILMQDLALTPSLGPHGVPRLSYRSWINLLEHAAADLHCLDFGMRLARLQSGGKVFGPVGMAMKNSRTFGEAIEYAAAHFHAHSLAAGLRLAWNEAEGKLFVSHEILLDGLPKRRQAIEQVLMLGHLNAVESTGGQARVREVHFRHQPLSSRSTYRAYFGCPVRFDEKEDGVVFLERDLRCPIIDRDVQIYASATSFIDTRLTRVRPPLHAQVRALIVRLIETEDCSNERICEELGLHPRTLHRRLKAEGKSFEGIKDEVRRDVALRYLQETDHSLSFIAEKLGYAEQSVLTRSCTRWFSACPSQLRSLRAA
jgi:AraC-like DNA-binding protein